MAGIKIIGLGKSQGDKVVTNDDLAQIVDTSDQWVRGQDRHQIPLFCGEQDQ